MITKTQLLSSLQSFPEQFSIDELIEKLIVIQKVEEGRQQSRDGKTNTVEEAKEKLGKWLK